MYLNHINLKIKKINAKEFFTVSHTSKICHIKKEININMTLNTQQKKKNSFFKDFVNMGTFKYRFIVILNMYSFINKGNAATLFQKKKYKNPN